MRKLFLLFAVLLCSAPMWAQGALFQGIAIGSNGRILASVPVRVCTDAATLNAQNQCTPLATIYTDETLGTPALNPTTTDAVGNYSIYSSAGYYRLQVCPGGVCGLMTRFEIAVPAFNPAVMAEIAAPAGASAYDLLWGDLANHRLAMNNNNGGTDLVVGQNTADTLTNKTLTSPTITGGTSNQKYVNGHCMVGQYSGADFGQKLIAAYADLNCGARIYDASDVTGAQSLSASVTTAPADSTTIFGNMNLAAGTNQLMVPAGTKNVHFRCSQANGSPNDTNGCYLNYTGNSAGVVVGDATADTPGFQWDNITIGITGAGAAAVGLQLNRATGYKLKSATFYGLTTPNTQKLIDLEGTGNYTGGDIYSPSLNNGLYGINFGPDANANYVYGGHCAGISTGTCYRLAGSLGHVISGNAIFGGDAENIDTAVYMDYATFNHVYGLRTENTTTYDVNFTANSVQNAADMGIGAAKWIDSTSGSNSFSTPYYFRTQPGRISWRNDADSQFSWIFTAGVAADQNIALIGRDKTGTNQWTMYLKDNLNAFDVVDTVNSLTRLQMILGGSTFINSDGTSPVTFNETASSGTGGIRGGNGSAADTWSISGIGLGTFNAGVTTPQQLASTVATGTAPLSVASTTVVPNLNASLLAGKDFTNNAATGAVYNAAGTQQTSSHVIWDTCTLGTNCSITLAGSAVFSSNTSYDCFPRDATTPANAVTVVRTSGSALAFTGTGTDVINYFCVGN